MLLIIGLYNADRNEINKQENEKDMYQVNITFADGHKGHITELFPTEEAANDAAVIWWLNQGEFDDATEIVKVNV